MVSVPLRGVGCFQYAEGHTYEEPGFRPLAGCGLFPLNGRDALTMAVSVPLRGVGCFQVQTDLYMPRLVSVPLRGVGCFQITPARSSRATGFRPLAGCGLFQNHVGRAGGSPEFPSPCGVWVVSLLPQRRSGRYGFRPLAGCGLFPSGRCLRHGLSGVSVPLRGVGCFQYGYNKDTDYKSFRPLAGCGLFPSAQESMDIKKVSVPLRGVGCFPRCAGVKAQRLFPSPCGVWVVSKWDRYSYRIKCFRPLAGCGLFHTGGK